MLESVLIANRGEIARRIMRTARRLGVRTIAVYSEADAGAPHVREADEAILIGPAPARESYLVAERMLDAARQTGAAAIHPGYGFLSENAGFAQAVIEAGLVWVGPPPAAILAMGLKDAAKQLMADAGVPVTPGYHGDDQSDERLAAEAERIGYPVLIKAVAGGGGKGMRKVDKAADFAQALAGARREAGASFGDERVLVETYVSRPRHIEVQVFGDALGDVVHLFERDCSLQRRHQKVIEEAPAPGMDEVTRAAVCEAAVRAAKAVSYVGAGTVEFIADASEGLRADRIWFMEMNTRLQVEHPVTEMVTGLDLVEWQLRVASGEPLPLSQDQIALRGWAMEARLYAETPEKKFLPSTGRLERLRFPDGVRVDSGVEEGGSVTHFYDPMIAKLVAGGQSRTEAATTLAEACRQVQAWPVKTNAAFLARCISHADFLTADIDTHFIESRLAELIQTTPPSAETLKLAAAAVAGSPPLAAGFRLNAEPRLVVRLMRNGTVEAVSLSPADLEHGALDDQALRQPGKVVVFQHGAAFAFQTAADAVKSMTPAGTGEIRAPMPGRITALEVEAGTRVKKGQPLVVLEAMKMEHVLAAPFDGTVTELAAVQGAQVQDGAVLVRVAPAS